MRTIIGAQGEITIFQIETMPATIETTPVERNAHGFIISHSESLHGVNDTLKLVAPSIYRKP